MSARTDVTDRVELQARPTTGPLAVIAAATLALLVTAAAMTVAPRLAEHGDTGYLLSGVLMTGSDLLLLLGVVALTRSAAVRDGRLKTTSSVLAILGSALTIPAEVWLRVDFGQGSTAFGVAGPLQAVGLIGLGLGIVLTGCWTGWHRFAWLLLGLYVPTVLIPSLAASDGQNLTALAGFHTLVLLAGVAFLHQTNDPRRGPHPRNDRENALDGHRRSRARKPRLRLARLFVGRRVTGVGPTMRVLVAAALVAGVATGSIAWAKPKPATATSEVRGGWANEAGAVISDLKPTGDPNVFAVTFTGGSVYDGGFTGHTVVHGDGTIATSGEMDADYAETFYGTYSPDLESAPRTGSFTMKGHLHITSDLQFTARAKIVSGTCGFAGSTGSMAYSGMAVNGGYVGSWSRPAPERGPLVSACPTGMNGARR
jgi:hypothetical protein